MATGSVTDETNVGLPCTGKPDRRQQERELVKRPNNALDADADATSSRMDDAWGEDEV